MSDYQIANLLGMVCGSLACQFILYIICKKLFRAKTETAIIITGIVGVLANGLGVACLAWIFAGLIYLIKRFIVTRIWPKQREAKEKREKDALEKKNTESAPSIKPKKPLNDSEEYWSFTSFVYSKVKQTNIFKLWRREQFDCQFGKCAICGKPMDRRYTQVDHIKPRYKHGTNYSDNLALTHKKCNENKGARTGYARPDWFKDNKYSEKLDEKVYELTEEVRKEYPTKFPDELFERP